MPEPYETETGRLAWSVRYHVPRSQVWERSRGRQSGNVHLHLPIEPREKSTFTATTGRKTTITRSNASALCGRTQAWYDRPANADEAANQRCPKCVVMAERYGIAWPPSPLTAFGPHVPDEDEHDRCRVCGLTADDGRAEHVEDAR